MTVFGYLVLICIFFDDFISLFSFNWEDTLNTQDTSEFVKNTLLHIIFSTLSSECLELWSNKVFCVGYIPMGGDSYMKR